jgi:hypothetical protein
MCAKANDCCTCSVHGQSKQSHHQRMFHLHLNAVIILLFHINRRKEAPALTLDCEQMLFHLGTIRLKSSLFERRTILP